jgi:hypothetical protein
VFDERDVCQVDYLAARKVDPIFVHPSILPPEILFGNRNLSMISDHQSRFYWGLWSKAIRVLLNGRETFTGDEENKRRHELQVRVIGRDKSHYDLTNREFDLVIAELRAVIAPGVEPVFPDANGRENAINYAKTRQGFGQGEIRVLDAAGEILQAIRFDDREKTL